MARALIVLALAVAPASASPLSLELGGGDGIGYASRAGAYRDDGYVEARLGIQLNCRVVLDPGLSWNTARIEPGVHLGVRVRLLEQRRPIFYLRGDAALVAATHIGSNYDLTVGAGIRHRFSQRWAVFAELDTIARVGEVETLSIRAELGVAFQSKRFWQ